MHVSRHRRVFESEAHRLSQSCLDLIRLSLPTPNIPSIASRCVPRGTEGRLRGIPTEKSSISAYSVRCGRCERDRYLSAHNPLKYLPFPDFRCAHTDKDEGHEQRPISAEGAYGEAETSLSLRRLPPLHNSVSWSHFAVSPSPQVSQGSACEATTLSWDQEPSCGSPRRAPFSTRAKVRG